MRTQQIVTSTDGTAIAFDLMGDGAPLVLVEPAGHFRGFSAFDELRPRLARRFTVCSYDRRGRGASGDASDYSPQREIQDLAAIAGTFGRPACIYGYSSGALLALCAAAEGVAIEKLALLEPPLREAGAAPDPLTEQLAELVAQGRRADAVEHFHLSIGVPTEYVEQMRGTTAFEAMTSIAHTLVYDCRISEEITPDLLEAVRSPTLVLDSEGSTDNLSGWAVDVARRLPCATHRSLPGKWHSVDSEALAETLTDFFAGSAKP